MPLYVGYTQKRRKVKLYTAGETVYLLIKNVGGTFDLQALVNDETNLRNYELLWEQLTGEPVILSSVNTLSTSFQILEKSDKLFRFSLDLGTNREQVEEVTVYFTPTSEHEFFGGTRNYPNRNEQTKYNQSFGNGYTLPEHSGVFNPQVAVVSGLGIKIEQPKGGLAGKVINTRLYGAPGRWTHNPTDIIYDIPSYDGTATEFFGVEWGSYIVELTYDLGTHNEVKYRSDAIFAKPGQVGSEGFTASAVDDLFSMPAGGTKNKLTDILRFINSSNNSESNYVIQKPGDVVAKLLEVKKFTNQKIDNLESDYIFSSNGGVIPKLLVFTRLDPSSIGSN